MAHRIGGIPSNILGFVSESMRGDPLFLEWFKMVYSQHMKKDCYGEIFL